MKFYLCDKKQKCNKSTFCGVECYHTSDRSHAIAPEIGQFEENNGFYWQKVPINIIRDLQRDEEANLKGQKP